MITEIIAIGTEITSGTTLDINTQYIANRLFEYGLESYYHTAVDDCPIRLEDVMKTSLNRSDIIITTGGLGPTEDDLTKNIIAKSLDLKLELDEEMENKIKDMFAKMNRTMTNNNKKQAFKPTGSKFIENSVGTAPGIFIEKDNKIIILLPGPPKEMINMYEKEVIPLLRTKLKQETNIIKESINTVGIGESYLETRLLSMSISTKNIDITTFAGEGTVEIRIIGRGKNRDILEEEINIIKERITKEFSQYIYSYNNKSLEEAVVHLLKEKKYKLGLCESCTGGLISSKITRVSGASDVLDRSIVTYSNNAKIEELSVKKETLDKYGAVSEETAYEMAKGLLDKTSNLDIALSITGIAGPSGVTIDKPVGLVYICVMDRYKHKIIKNNFNGDRLSIQNRGAIKALDEIRRFISNNH